MKSIRTSLFVLAALTLANAALAQPPGVKVLKDLPYIEKGHARNKLDLYLPQDVKGPLPVVVWIHGGAWWAGSKEGCPAVWLSGKGYAVASINYRLSQHAVFPAQIEDCKAAIRWLRANAGKYHLDPDHIGVWGASAGGHLVALLGTAGGAKDLEGKGGNADQSSRVQCVVDWFGPTDLIRITSSDDKPDGPVAKLLGGTVHENRDKAKKASPFYYVDKNSAPFLIMHGDKDHLVPLEQSELLEEALKKAGVEAKLDIIKDNGHGGPGFNTPAVRKEIEEFFDKHLKGKEGTGKADAKADSAPAKPRLLITISKETTYITGPLRKDGYVDYLGSLNARSRKGVTPENNAAVLFWQAVGPSEIIPKIRTRYFQMMEMSAPPEQGNYFVSYDKFMQKFKDANAPRLPQPTLENQESEWDQLQKAVRRPWSMKELPLLGEWVAANDKPLTLLVEATKRPRRYDPLLCANGDQGMVGAILWNPAEQSREVGRALAARAMLRLGGGKVEEAWDDLLACHRLARLEGQGPTVIEALLAIAIDRIACNGDQAVLQSTLVRANQIETMREDLARLAPMPKMADKFDISERFILVDCVAVCARDGITSFQTFDGSSKPDSLEAWFLDVTARMVTDWDSILRLGNSWYDRIATAGRIAARGERRKAFEQIEKELRALVNPSDPRLHGFEHFFGKSRKAVSQRVGYSFFSLLIPALSAAINSEDQSEMQFEITRLGFALAAYHLDHGTYPEKLSDLTKYVAKLPVDFFTDNVSLHYKRQGAGYLLYSVGINGRDDGGRGYYDRKEGEICDDISIRVP